jgi:hypothetical protein
VLSRARWEGLDEARRLLLHLLAAVTPGGEVVTSMSSRS